jgi:hypothetical protein
MAALALGPLLHAQTPEPVAFEVAFPLVFVNCEF